MLQLLQGRRIQNRLNAIRSRPKAEGGTGDLFYTMNKEAAGDDLGLTLQTGFVTKALVALGMLNSRMKDFFDLWAISETFSFDGPVLAEAIAATFDRRRTAIPVETPVALRPAFAENAAKQAQWQGFLRRTALAMAPGPFAEMQAKVAAFVLPPARALVASMPFEGKWAIGGPWR